MGTSRVNSPSSIREVATVETGKKNNPKPRKSREETRGRPLKPLSLIKKGEDFYVEKDGKLIKVEPPSGYKLAKKNTEDLKKDLEKDEGLGPVTK